MSLDPLIALDRVTKHYPRPGSSPFTVLADVHLEIASGELVALLGKSGSGKSTLLNVIAGLDRPTNGTVTVAGTALQELSEDMLAVWRGRTVGIVFQFFQLLPTLTILENVLLAMDLRGIATARERRERAYHLLEQVGIVDQASKLPATLSGGQQQRAAIARALANNPPVLLADEPTGNLDSRNAAAILSLFADLVARGTTLLVVTHDAEVARQAQRIVHVVDGKVHADAPQLVGGVA
jgi:putative ABC transport system ATP-binding protein